MAKLMAKMKEIKLRVTGTPTSSSMANNNQQGANGVKGGWHHMQRGAWKR
jgi:hypothetical protein